MDFNKLLIDKYGIDNKRYIHSIGVKNMAIKLAELLNEDTKKAEIAALFHDYYRYDDEAELIKLMDNNDYLEYKDYPWAFHGLAAGNMIKNYGINDIDIINAIKYHTTARYNMSMLEKIIYVADFAEENRKHNGSSEVRELAFIDFNKAFMLNLRLIYEHEKDPRLLDLIKHYGG